MEIYNIKDFKDLKIKLHERVFIESSKGNIYNVIKEVYFDTSTVKEVKRFVLFEEEGNYRLFSSTHKRDILKYLNAN